MECKESTFSSPLSYGPDLLICTDRVINLTHVADKTEVEAWKAVKQASDELDIADFKEAVQVLVKACPELTYPKLEKEFRKRNMDIYLIALVSLCIANPDAGPLTQLCVTGERSWRHPHVCQPTRRARQKICCGLLHERQASASKHEGALAKISRREPQET